MVNIDFDKAVQEMADMGFHINPDLVYIKIPYSRALLFQGLKHFAGQDAKWLPEYEKVAAWMEDNHGRGLFLYGDCGRGKTLIGRRILPLLLLRCCRKVVATYDAVQLNSSPDEIISKHILSIDDIGTESIAVKYGERRMILPELVDQAEKKGKLLILTSNLTKEALEEKYGTRTIERIVSTTTRVEFKGSSLRE